MKIREIRVVDAEAYINLLKELDKESPFLLCEPDERDHDVDKMKEKILFLNSYQASYLIVAEDAEKLIGFALVEGNELLSTRHCAKLIIGVLEAYQGQGYGKALLTQTIEHAREINVRRLELTVLTHNKKALWLFSTLGFTVEGTRRFSIKMEDTYRDEFYMSLLIK